MRRDDDKIVHVPCVISIHAPVKGATCPRRGILFASFFISIHAPVKGATTINEVNHDKVENFNPRTREGCDAMGQTDAANYIKISIHAPVKGATI